MKKNILLITMTLAMLAVGCNAQKQDAQPSALDVIMSRVSVREFTGDPVSKEQLETILKAGMAAPSAMNMQPWRFVVLTDHAKIEQLLCKGPRSGMFQTAGAVIIVCGQTTAMRKPFGQPDAPEEKVDNIF